MRTIRDCALEVLVHFPRGMHFTPEQNRALASLLESVEDITEAETEFAARVKALEEWKDQEERQGYHAQLCQLHDEVARLEREIENLSGRLEE